MADDRCPNPNCIDGQVCIAGGVDGVFDSPCPDCRVNAPFAPQPNPPRTDPPISKKLSPWTQHLATPDPTSNQVEVGAALQEVFEAYDLSAARSWKNLGMERLADAIKALRAANQTHPHFPKAPDLPQSHQPVPGPNEVYVPLPREVVEMIADPFGPDMGSLAIAPPLTRACRQALQEPVGESVVLEGELDTTTPAIDFVDTWRGLVKFYMDLKLPAGPVRITIQSLPVDGGVEDD